MVLQKRRLEVLAKHLERIERQPLHKRKFSLSSWYQHLIGSDGIVYGTTACALGEAGLIPEFRKLGLKSEIDGGVYFQEKEGFEAAEVFFGLDMDESLHLFAPTHYWPDQLRSPRAVARKIRRLIAGEPI